MDGTWLSSKKPDILKNTSGVQRATKPPIQADDLQDDPQYPVTEITYRNLRPRKSPQSSWIHYILEHWVPGLCIGVIFIVFARIVGIHVYVGIVNTVITPIAERNDVAYVDVPFGKGSTERVLAIMDGTNNINLLLTLNGDTAHAKTILGPQALAMYNPQKAHLHVRIGATNLDGKSIAVIVTAEGPLQANGLDIVPDTGTWKFDVKTTESNT